MQVRCASCYALSDSTAGTYSVLQAWCPSCQQPRSFLPVLKLNSSESGAAISFSELNLLLDHPDTATHVKSLIENSLQGKLTKSDEDGLIFLLNDHVRSLSWAFEMIQLHPIWKGNLYNIAMNAWR